MPGALWSGLISFYVGGVWLCLSLLVASNNSYLANSVGYKPFYPDSVGGMQRYFLIKKALNPLGFAAAQVTFTTLNPHNFATTGNMEAALRPFMSFKFWHSELPLPLLLS